MAKPVYNTIMINTDPFLSYVFSAHQSLHGCPFGPSYRQVLTNGEKTHRSETAYAPHSGFGDGVCTQHRTAFVRAGMSPVVQLIAIHQKSLSFL